MPITYPARSTTPAYFGSYKKKRNVENKRLNKEVSERERKKNEKGVFIIAFGVHTTAFEKNTRGDAFVSVRIFFW